jgi:NAD(P)H-flavin reductase
VRSFPDSFYEKKIAEVGKDFTDFEYIQYFSRESEFPTPLSSDHTLQLQGYVTDWISAESIIPYEEFYICGSPAMVKSAREKLDTLGIAKENILWEQF